MSFRTFRYLSIVLGIIGLALDLSGQTGLSYQPRGDRWEGLKPSPVSNVHDVELISACADYFEDSNAIPDNLKIRFFLPSPKKVFVTVRELDNRHFYWMDNINPAVPWKQGFSNIFQWPTSTVISHLQGLKMYDLGIVARFSEKMESSEEVAPAIYYYLNPPTKINAYRMYFKTSADVSQLKVEVYDQQNKTVLSSTLPDQFSGRPFSFKADLANQKEGNYKLVLTGVFPETNHWINQSVLFYHRALVK